jgi:nucleoside 2-deoxyribosyltransferase
LKKKIYLSGTFHKNPDRGKAERERFIEIASKYPDLEILDPRLMDADDQEGERTFSNTVIRDLRAISECSLLVVFYTRESAGTMSEMTFAALCGIPILFITDEDPKTLNPWIQYCMEDKARFYIKKTWEDIIHVFLNAVSRRLQTHNILNLLENFI